MCSMKKNKDNDHIRNDIYIPLYFSSIRVRNIVHCELLVHTYLSKKLKSCSLSKYPKINPPNTQLLRRKQLQQSIF